MGWLFSCISYLKLFLLQSVLSTVIINVFCFIFLYIFFIIYFIIIMIIFNTCLYLRDAVITHVSLYSVHVSIVWKTTGLPWASPSVHITVAVELPIVLGARYTPAGGPGGPGKEDINC